MRKPETSAKGGNAGRNRSHNRRVVLDYVGRHEPVGRAEIARSSGLSVQAVSNITDALESEGLLHADGIATGKRGKPVVQYRFNPNNAFAVGLELRPDALVCTILNLSGALIFTDTRPIENATPDRAIPLACTLVDATIAKAGRDRSRLLGVGVVMPGPFGESALNKSGAANLPGWEGTNIAQRFEAAMGCSVIVENDATAAAISERVAGGATQISNFCYIYFGTGLGLGVIADGHAQRGAFGNFGEIGHIVTQAGGNPCTCGNNGCLETYASCMSLTAFLEDRGLAQTDRAGLNQLLTQQNPDLMHWIAQAAAHLSQAIGMLENIFDPETIILGGAMPDTILDALITRLDLPKGSVANQKSRQVARVIRSASGRNTAAIGGASMVVHKTTTPTLTVFN